MSGKISIAGRNETSSEQITPLSIYNTTKQYFNTTDAANNTNVEGIANTAETFSSSESAIMTFLGILVPIVIFIMLGLFFWWKNKRNMYVTEQRVVELEEAESTEPKGGANGNSSENDQTKAVDENTAMI